MGSRYSRDLRSSISILQRVTFSALKIAPFHRSFDFYFPEETFNTKKIRRNIEVCPESLADVLAR